MKRGSAGPTVGSRSRGPRGPDSGLSGGDGATTALVATNRSDLVSWCSRLLRANAPAIPLRD